MNRKGINSLPSGNERQIVGLTLNWRDPERTVTCVASLLGEGIFHVLILDNSDDSGQSAVALKQALGENPSVTILQSPANLGFAAGVNLGLTWIVEHCPCSWVVTINNDAKLLPGAVDAMRNALEVNPSSFLAYPNISHDGCVLGGLYYHRISGLLRQSYFPGCFRYASGCCLLVATDRHPGSLFDEDFFMYGEDTELGWRLSKMPETMVHVPQNLVVHEGSASSGLGSPFYEARMVAAHLILARKLTSNTIDYFLLLTCRVALLPLRATVRALRFWSLVPIKALWSGFQIARGNDPVALKGNAYIDALLSRQSNSRL